jgi:CRISPR-associated protein Csb1
MLDTTPLEAVSRLTMEADLQPLQGSRFQATGFPDLGPARFRRSDGVEMLLVESAQSMANRLEAVCWDGPADAPVAVLQGLPYVRVVWGDGPRAGEALTNSLLESHRLNSPYILEGKDRTVIDLLSREVAGLEKGAVDFKRLARLVFKYDPNAVLHGVFLAKKELAGGRLRMTRAMSSFVEAQGVLEADSGGVKNDRVDPAGDTSKGFGNVPFHRSEFTAKRITAFFSLDLALLRSYCLGDAATEFLIVFALWKIRRLLTTALRFRTACDLEPVSDLTVTRPAGFALPLMADLEVALRAGLSACQEQALFANPAVTTVKWQAKAAAKKEQQEGSAGTADRADSRADEMQE